MSIKESALTAITAISNSDFVRAVTSAGASRRITVANLAKQIVEGYAGSSLAGSSQSVKSAIDSLNSNFTLYDDTTATDASELCLAKFNAVVAKGTGVFFVNGGWKTKSFGFSVVSVFGTGRGIVLFVGQDTIYHAYINNGAVALIKKVTEATL